MRLDSSPSHLQQRDSPGQHTLLLQYVIFPYVDDVTKQRLQSALWVEPQHGVVCDSPTALGYLKGLTYDQISSKVWGVLRMVGVVLKGGCGH